MHEFPFRHPYAAYGRIAQEYLAATDAVRYNEMIPMHEEQSRERTARQFFNRQPPPGRGEALELSHLLERQHGASSRGQSYMPFNFVCRGRYIIVVEYHHQCSRPTIVATSLQSDAVLSDELPAEAPYLISMYVER
jgi:hypothetical protein